MRRRRRRMRRRRRRRRMMIFNVDQFEEDERLFLAFKFFSTNRPVTENEVLLY
jgi:hypothetical protein